MFRTMMLTGLMTVTVLAGVAPAFAQMNDNGRPNRGERAGRQGGDVQRQLRGDGQGQGQQRWQERRAERQAERPLAQPDQQQVQVQTERTVQSGDDIRNGRDRDGRQSRQDWRNDRRDVRQDVRQDAPVDRQDARQDQHRDGRQNGRPDIGYDGRRENSRGWAPIDRNSNERGNWNSGRRFDSRNRWSTQQRWNDGWRQDRRYDWSSYRNRYGDRFRVGRYAAPRGWDYGYRRFSVGIILSSLLYSNSYWLSDPYAYHLPPAYGTLRWVRYYDDAMLVDIRDGYVVDVIHDFFW